MQIDEERKAGRKQKAKDGSPIVTKPDRCTGCGWCEIHCPDFAISLREVADGKAQGEEAE
jgi:2-oxoglutarate ferredoxin oxidoreductase subunit delta